MNNGASDFRLKDWDKRGGWLFRVNDGKPMQFPVLVDAEKRIFVWEDKEQPKIKQLLIVEDLSSEAPVSPHNALQLAMVILQVEPWQLDVIAYVPGQTELTGAMLLYLARWLGPADMMAADAKHMEYRVGISDHWETFK